MLCIFADNSETNEDGAHDEEEAATAREPSNDQEEVAEEWGRFLHVRDKANHISFAFVASCFYCC